MILTAAAPIADISLNAFDNYYTVVLTGNFDGGTVTLEISIDDVIYVTEPDSAETADATYLFIASVPFARFVLTGAGGSASVKVWMNKLNNQ